MERSRRNLKNISILVLIFTGLSLARALAQVLLGGLSVDGVADEAMASLVQVFMIVGFAVGLLLLLPQIYIGLKGLKLSKSPDSSKGHITWAKILLVLSIIAAVSPVIALLKAENVVPNITTLLDIAVDIIVYVSFIKYAKEVSLAK